MIRIHKNATVPKFCNGVWDWDDKGGNPNFKPRIELKLENEGIITTNDFKFRRELNQLEEYVFRRDFQRPEDTHDADFILVQDIKNLVLFLAPSNMLTKRFLEFIHTKTIHTLLHSLIIYFEYYLRVLEFVLIRRDEVSGKTGQIQSKESVAIKKIYSARLTQYRLLVAREYRTLILGEDDMQKFYHIMPLVNISQTETDRDLHEKFIAFATQVVWIAMHRRAYDDIDQEMGRLFRSDHFNLRKEKKIFAQSERDLLFGQHYKVVNYRYQTSPLTQEITKISTANSPILYFGHLKYRGTDYRMHHLEMEFLVPESQLMLIDIVHGILGHPKKVYNTLLKIDEEALREEKYSEDYDPFRIMRQPVMDIPKLDEEAIRRRAEHWESFFSIKKDWETISVQAMQKWLQRDSILDRYRTEGIVVDILEKATIEANETDYGPSSTKIREDFVKRRDKLVKHKD